MTEGWSKKIYVELLPPTEDDNRSDSERILDGLKEREDLKDERIRFSPSVLRRFYQVCEKAQWNITITLGFDGTGWENLDVEAGDTTEEHYGLCTDLGSTTIVMELVDMNRSEAVARETIFNPQTAFGEDILTRIFYTKDNEENRE